MHEKSEGLLQYERETANLEKRIERGELGSIEEVATEHGRILADAAPGMSDNELLRIRDRALVGHGILAEILADFGQPVPGNDPNKPN